MKAALILVLFCVFVVLQVVAQTPTADPTTDPTAGPTATPTANPTATPTATPTANPTATPTATPTADPTATPTANPTATPTANPTAGPTANPTANPTAGPTANPTAGPTANPTANPTAGPTANPTTPPTAGPTAAPTTPPTHHPTGQPTGHPSSQPSMQPSSKPSGQPSSMPTSSPTYHKEAWGQTTWDKKRHRTGGLCENHCSNHGTCEVNNNCNCFTGLDGEAEWTGPDCSLRMCPRDFAWVGDVINANNLSPWAECSNKGSCDRTTGACACFPGYEGVACQRTVCPNNCNERGTCWPEKHLAAKVGRVYTAPWDAMKNVGCLCDSGYRGPDCSLQECPGGADVLGGYGNEAGRDCSGRGLCNYNEGTCSCFSGFYGTRCQHQTTLF